MGSIHERPSNELQALPKDRERYFRKTGFESRMSKPKPRRPLAQRVGADYDNMKPFSRKGIQNARREGRLLNYLVKRIDAIPTIPEEWVTTQERESAIQQAQVAFRESQAAEATYLRGRRHKIQEIKRRMDVMLDTAPQDFLNIITDEDEPLGYGMYQLVGELPTEKQLNFLRRLKFAGDPPRTKKDASKLIDQILREKGP